MIVDTSAVLAVLAVLFAEPDAARYAKAISGASTCRLSAAGFLEAAIVAESRGGTQAGHELDVFLERAGMELVPVTPDHAAAARRAWRRFGKGNHPAGLNFGDCFSYAPGGIRARAVAVQGRGLRSHRYRGFLTDHGPDEAASSGMGWACRVTVVVHLGHSGLDPESSDPLIHAIDAPRFRRVSTTGPAVPRNSGWAADHQDSSRPARSCCVKLSNSVH